jgi:hypothetical protein
MKRQKEGTVSNILHSLNHVNMKIYFSSFFRRSDIFNRQYERSMTRSTHTHAHTETRVYSIALFVYFNMHSKVQCLQLRLKATKSRHKIRHCAGSRNAFRRKYDTQNFLELTMLGLAILP